MVLLLALVLTVMLAACGTGKEEPAPEGETVYRVLVLTEEDTPVKGAVVQLCRDACFPGVTNERGEAVFSVPEDDYKVAFAMLPEGYDCADSVQEFRFEDGSRELTIRLKEAS